MPDNKIVKKLLQVDDVRKPFEPLLKQSVKKLCETYIPQDQRDKLVELGTGTGKLIDWLGSEWKDAILFTEPDPAAAQYFQKKYSKNCVNASAEKIPAEKESLNGILSLCVLDIVKDINTIAQETAMRLKQGGVFIHLLDMSVNYNFILRELKKHQLIPLIPPPLTHPKLWQEDLILCDQTQFSTLCELLKRQKQNNYRILEEYLQRVSSGVGHARTFLETLELGNDKTQIYQAALHEAIEWLESKNIGLREIVSVHSASSLQLFSQALEEAFCDNFEIINNAPLTNEEATNNYKDSYQCFCAGTRFEFALSECDKETDFLFPTELTDKYQKCELKQTAIHVFCATKK